MTTSPDSRPSGASRDDEVTGSGDGPTLDAAAFDQVYIDDLVDSKSFDRVKLDDLTLDPAGKNVTLTEEDRLAFARDVLMGLAAIVGFVIIGYGFSPWNQEAWQDMFEIVKIGALPLVTLIVGFYFPSSNR